MNYKHIKTIVAEMNENIMFLEPKFDKALIGSGQRCGEETVAVYSSTECIKILMKVDKMSDLEAYEHFEGTLSVDKKTPYKPIFISDFRKIKIPTKKELDEIADIFEDSKEQEEC